MLTEFLKNKHALYFLATQESENANMKLFQEKVADFTGNELLKEVRVDRWDTIFKAIIAKKWDELLKAQNIMIILCGSLIPMMVSQTLSYESPLYGRRTAQIRLKQIPFIYYRDFFQNHVERDLVERYAVTGGVPKYIESFDDQEDIYDSIRENLLDKSSYLHEEPYFLLQQEVKDVGTYFSILKAIAAGNRKISEIASAMEVHATDLTRSLKTLMDLDLLEREVPITEKNPDKSKKGLYKISDQYINFWFRFIYPNQGDIEQGNTEYVIGKIQKGFVRNHVAFVYEDICRERLAKLTDFPYHFSKYGRYWDKNIEIDVVGINEEENSILFGECKYWNKPVDVDVFYALKKKASEVKWGEQDRTEVRKESVFDVIEISFNCLRFQIGTSKENEIYNKEKIIKKLALTS